MVFIAVTVFLIAPVSTVIDSVAPGVIVDAAVVITTSELIVFADAVHLVAAVSAMGIAVTPEPVVDALVACLTLPFVGLAGAVPLITTVCAAGISITYPVLWDALASIVTLELAQTTWTETFRFIQAVRGCAIHHPVADLRFVQTSVAAIQPRRPVTIHQ